jgi:hypothetical protein
MGSSNGQIYRIYTTLNEDKEIEKFAAECLVSGS